MYAPRITTSRVFRSDTVSSKPFSTKCVMPWQSLRIQSKGPAASPTVQGLQGELALRQVFHSKPMGICHVAPIDLGHTIPQCRMDNAACLCFARACTVPFMFHGLWVVMGRRFWRSLKICKSEHSFEYYNIFKTCQNYVQTCRDSTKKSKTQERRRR